MDDKNANRASVSQHVVRETPALWGGIECSITRIRERFQDQLKLAAYYEHPEYLDLVADLGISALRFPILFEKHQPRAGQEIDWTWAREQLKKLQDHNITPIVGLVHHGSGPAYTNLLDPRFAEHLSDYARNVAQEFPSLQYYTPVNEPLTTARFSGLYGLWYPHHTSDRSFCKMLLNELAAVVLSMQEIRKINPAAKLVQTEDLGKVYAGSNLRYQADFENERRWITFDILCGRVDQDHFLWQYFIDNGITPKELEFFLNHPCPPDILGLNYYVTSERYLDDNLAIYPAHLHGGNHIEKYVDTEAIRVKHKQPSGLKMLLHEVHDRYSLPMAMTEVHLHCTRDEQMRWFKEIWEICCSVKSAGVQLQAVTSWSLFGAYGWNKLLTSEDCDYEPGVFDLRGPYPRATEMANLLRAVSREEQYHHPTLAHRGWWHSGKRFNTCSKQKRTLLEQHEKATGTGIVIAGNDALCHEFVRACEIRSIPAIHVADPASMNLHHAPAPWAVVYVAGREEQSDADLSNAGLRQLARNCNERLQQLMIVTTPEALPKNHSRVYSEKDEAITPIEQLAIEYYPSALLIRTGWLFNPRDPSNFGHQMLEGLRNNKSVAAPSKIAQSYSYTPDLVNAALDLLIDKVSGPVHLVHPEKYTAFDFAKALCQTIKIHESIVTPIEEDHEGSPIIACENYKLLPAISCSIEKFVEDSELMLDEKDKVLIKSN